MKLKKIFCIVLSSVILFGICAGYSFAASKTITGLEIISLPKKTVFIKDIDWFYGLWDINESTGEVISVSSTKISFTHNPCGGIYPERGMLDMTGLSILVSYSDGTTKTINYTETKNSSGIYSANILFSPKKAYSLGTNTIEVYLAENTKFYDSYEIEIIEDPYEALTSESAVIDYNNFFISGLEPKLTKAMLQDGIFDFGDAEVTFTKAEKNFRYYGTGSTLTLTHVNGTVETFTLIVSCDVDGNGILNYDDVSIVNCAVADNSILTKAQTKAAEVDGIRRITANDVSLIVKTISG